MKKSETSKSPKRAADPSGDVGAKDAKKLMTAKAMVSPTTVSKVKEFCKVIYHFKNSQHKMILLIFKCNNTFNMCMFVLTELC